jgi:WD40 repeat protein
MTPEERGRIVGDLFLAARKLFGAERTAFLDAACAELSGDIRHEVESLLRTVEEALAEGLIPDAPGGEPGTSVTGSVSEVTVERSDTIRSGPEQRQHPANPAGHGLHIRCPHCHNPIEIAAESLLEDIICNSCGSHISLVHGATGTRDAQELARVAHFELIERLGIGGFGTVWKARDTRLDRPVAIKIPRSGQLSPESQQKFLREARAASQLRHPNIVGVHEVGRHGDTIFIVSDLVRGVSLSDWLSGKKLTAREAVALCSKLSGAIEHAHQRGVIHRDLKPHNILMDADGEPHITDFGLAKREADEVTVTRDGQVLGTPAYMAPEQASGQGYRADRRADVYSLGVVLYQLTTGELPFRGNAKMIIHQVLHDEPPRPRRLNGNIPADVETICLKCLEKDPNRRYASAAALQDDLQRVLRHEPIAARPVGRIARTLRWCRRNPVTAALLAVILATMLAATAVSSTFGWLAHRQTAQTRAALADSLLQEVRLTTQLRQQGYGEYVRDLIQRAQAIPGSHLDADKLRREFVFSLGDFVAKPPRLLEPPFLEPSPAGPTVAMSALRLSPDGRQLVVGLNDGRIFAHDLARPTTPPTELKSLSADIRTIAFSANGDQLVAADREGLTQVWRRTETEWQPNSTFRAGPRLAERETLQAVIASPDGELLALWRRTPPGPPADDQAKDGDAQAGATSQRELEIWNVATASRLAVLLYDAEWDLRNAAFDRRNRRLAAAYRREDADSAGLVVWNLDDVDKSSRAPTHDVTLPNLGQAYSNAIAFARDGQQLAVGFDEALLLFDTSDFRQTAQFWLDATKAVAYDPANRYLAALSMRGRITLWNPHSKRQAATLSHPTMRDSRENLVFSDDASRLAVSNGDTIRVWDCDHGSYEKNYLTGHGRPVPVVAFHPDGHALATGGKDHQLHFWNAATGDLVDTIDLQAEVQALAFSPDGRTLAVGLTGAQDAPNLRIMEYATRRVLSAISPATGPVFSLHAQPGGGGVEQGPRLAACGPGGVALYRFGPGEPTRLPALPANDEFWCPATRLSPDGRWLIYAQDRDVRAWDLHRQQQQPIHAPPLNQGWHSLDFFPDSDSFLYVAGNGTVQVWSVGRDEPVATIGRPGTFGVPHVALSPDGRWLAALTQPDVISVWHLPTRKEMFALRPEGDAVWSLAWSPASDRLAAGRVDGSVAVWHLARIREKLSEVELAWEDR